MVFLECFVLMHCNIEIASYTKLFFGESDRQKQEGQNKKTSETNRKRLRAIRGISIRMLKANQIIPKVHFNFGCRCIIFNFIIGDILYYVVCDMLQNLVLFTTSTLWTS